MAFVPLSQAEEQPRGFVPLADDFSDTPEKPVRGFTPLKQPEPERPSMAKQLLLNNPATAAVEAGANLASQAIALPVAGLAGLATEAGNALGLTERKGADVVQHIAEGLTYSPKGEMGKQAAGIVAYPFEKLAEAGQWAGGKTLEATDSPLAATAVDTAIQGVLPLIAGPAAKKGGAVVKESIVGKAEAAPEVIVPEAQGTNAAPAIPEAGRPAESALARESANLSEGLTNEQRNLEHAQGGVRRLVEPESPMQTGIPPDQRGLSELQPVRGVDGIEAPEGTVAATDGRSNGLYAGERLMGEEAAAQERARQVAAGTETKTSPIAETPLPEGVRRLAQHESALLQPETSPMGELRRGRDQGLPGVAEQLREIPDRLGAETRADLPAFARGSDTGFRPGEHPLGTDGNLGRAEGGVAGIAAEGRRATAVDGREGYRGAAVDAVGAARQGADHTRSVAQQTPVLDLNDGPLSRAAAIAAPELVKRAPEPAATTAPSKGFTPLAETQRAAQPGTEYSFAPGKAYAGFIDDSPQPGTVTAPASAAGRDKPLRREDIIIPFAKDLGASIFTGRVKMKNALGFFRRGNEEVRIKRHADLETTAHEMAHLIDSRVPALANEWRSNKPLREQLKSVSYDHKSVTEGFAEGVRLWMTQSDVLQQRAPLVHDWLTNFAATDKRYGPAMRKAQEGMTGWFAQDAVDRARSKIGDHRPLSEAMNGIFDRFRQSTVDDLHGVYRMERELQGGKLLPVGAYESARLSRASASIADGAVRFGYPVKRADGAFEYRGKGLQDILKPVADHMDDALLYFVGRSANELMLQGREHLFTKGEIKGMLALETPEARKAFAEYQQWNRGVLDFAEAQGVLNPETRAKWKRTEYLPFHRVEQPGGLKGKPGDWSGVQALTGGTENIKDVLGNMIGNAAQLIDVAVKNEARVKIANLASRPGGGRFMVKIDPGSRPVKVSGSQVLDEMAKRYGLLVDGEAPAFFQFLLHNQPPAGGNVVAVLKGGKPVWYEVADPILYRSLQAIDRPPMDWLTKWLGYPKRVGQATITLTPDFMLANIARDTIMGAVMSRSGFRPVIDSMKGMRLRMTEDPLYKDYIANGGGLSSLYLDEHHLRTKLEKFYSKQGIDARTVLDTPDKLLGFIETMADAFEMSTRMGEYERAIKRGEHPRHAAYQGREVSTDFAMRGDSKALGFLYDTVMFLRPAVVSMDRLYRGVAHDPNKAAIGAKTAMLALASVGLYLLNRDNPKYQDMEDWKKDSYWHFFIPGPDGSEQHFMYPKIWEVGAVASMAERTTAKLLQDNPDGLGKDFARIIGNTFSLNFMPQIVAPLYEQATNRNPFTKAPIETPGMENVQPFLRAKPNTSETMKALGMATRDLPESLQVPPARAEALLRGYLNTWGMYGLMLSDRAFFGDRQPEMRTDQMPVVRRFYSQEPPQHTKFETQFYDMLGEAKRLQGTLRELDRQGRPDIADQKEQGPLAGEAKPLERANKGLQGINADMRDVRRAGDLTPGEKRQRLDGLTVERNQLLKNAVLAARAAQGNR